MNRNKKAKEIKHRKNEKIFEVCSNCRKKFESSEYSKLCDAIMRRKPVCSFKCNKALGQVK